MKIKIRRCFSFILCAVLIFTAVGCGAKNPSLNENNTEELSEEASVSLLMQRQGMVGTSMLFGTAYLGYAAVPVENIKQWADTVCPQLSEDMPFIGEIPKNCVIGDRKGEIYCIVPRDEEATVVVNRMGYNDEGGWDVLEVLYRSEKGDPIILFCNSGEDSPDTQVIITGSDGESVEWISCLNDFGYIWLPTESEDAPPYAGDFTSYDEISLAGYQSWYIYGWRPPVEKRLSNTTWQVIDTDSDGREIVNFLELLPDGEARFERSFNGKNIAQEKYKGKWELLEGREDVILHLSLNMIGGELYKDGKNISINAKYPVLIDWSYDYIILGKAESEDTLPITSDMDFIITLIRAYG